MFQLVTDIHLSDIDSLKWEQLQRHAHCRILGMSVKGASTIFSFTSWVIYVLIGCQDSIIRYWQPLLGKSSVTGSLPHPANQREQSINDL